MYYDSCWPAAISIHMNLVINSAHTLNLVFAISSKSTVTISAKVSVPDFQAYYKSIERNHKSLPEFVAYVWEYLILSVDS
jgi:hypothetical protein